MKAATSLPVHLDVYQIITNRIIAELERNQVPWRRPWSETGPPTNLITKRPYRGINVLLLNSLTYPSNYFLGWQQLQSIGGSVRKGEKGNIIVFWKRLNDNKTEDIENEESTFKA